MEKERIKSKPIKDFIKKKNEFRIQFDTIIGVFSKNNIKKATIKAIKHCISIEIKETHKDIDNNKYDKEIDKLNKLLFFYLVEIVFKSLYEDILGEVILDIDILISGDGFKHFVYKKVK